MIKVIWGSNKEKPITSRQLTDALTQFDELDGYLYIGYPIVGAPNGPIKFDALLISEQKGIVAFDLVEGFEVGEYQKRQDEIATMLEVKLKPYPALTERRRLKFDINTFTFAPAIKRGLPESDPPYILCNDATSLKHNLDRCSWEENEHTFKSLLAAIQVVTNIRAGRLNRTVKDETSLGARLKKLEDSIANLDQHQSEAVIETVDGVQRIRGLAGSGKTIVLALKVAYLHAQNQDWKIAVTFHTRSLKEQFKRLINNFTIEQLGAEPDWQNIDIVNSWGAPGDSESDGIYHMFCKENNTEYYDYSTAKRLFGTDKAFEASCKKALTSVSSYVSKYDVILVDEAQDFPPDFLRLCYAFLNGPKRLVYAYDELQSLNGLSVLPPDELFGKDENGVPLVTLINDDPTQPKQDIILEKCYRNSRPLLATAHALGFGLKRDKGLVQFFDNDSLWEDVGYVVKDGSLSGGKNIVLTRTNNSSPLFLEEHTPIDELIKFESFDSREDMNRELVKQIVENINNDELRPEDIIVINPDPLSTQQNVGQPRVLLAQNGINSELAGVTTSRDIFSRAGTITFTGIFRAKGNEAGMVYIINAQDCFDSYDRNTLATIRNRLFTAITRSKAWVRVFGIGPNMKALISEFDKLKADKFDLDFIYPNEAEKLKLKLINRDMTLTEKNKQKRAMRQAADIVKALDNGDISPELLPDELWSYLDKLKK